MKRTHIIYSIILIASLIIGCSSNDNIFEKTPSERNKESITTLKDELVKAPSGWRVLSFPKTDSLLFSTPSELRIWWRLFCNEVLTRQYS